jgi:hypothetical protein
VIDFADYCRQLETHLCRKNGGHLIRIVGPAFELVHGWAEQGVPLKVACSGIDRYCERQNAKSARRRPVRIEFCEGDILALFDDWRRAVGVVHAAAGAQSQITSRKATLAAHLDRVVARLVGRRTPRSPAFEREVERILAELDPLSNDARHARGEARAAIVDRLESLDRELMAAAAADLDAPAAAALRREAEEELAGFAARMPVDARARAVDAAYQRLVRESLGLPIIRYG